MTFRIVVLRQECRRDVYTSQIYILIIYMRYAVRLTVPICIQFIVIRAVISICIFYIETLVRSWGRLIYSLKNTRNISPFTVSRGRNQYPILSIVSSSSSKKKYACDKYIQLSTIIDRSFFGLYCKKEKLAKVRIGRIILTSVNKF